MPCGGGCSTAPTPALAPPPAPAPELTQPKAPAPAPAAEVPAPEPALEEMPEETPPAAPPEEMPEETKPAKPSDDVDDLFKDTDASDKKSATAPTTNAAPEGDEKKSDDVDDLFKENDDNKSAVRPAAVLPPVATSAELEDLFVEPVAVAPQPVVKPAVITQAEPRQLEVLPAAHVNTPAETANALRVWTDNTGKYKINARLVTIGESSVRLLKDTGKYTTVSLDRLSEDDLEFVRRQNTTSFAGKF